MTRKDIILNFIISLAAAFTYDLIRNLYPRLLNIPIKSVSKYIFQKAKTEIYYLILSYYLVIVLLYDTCIQTPINKFLLQAKWAILSSQQLLKNTASLLIQFIRVAIAPSNFELSDSLKVSTHALNQIIKPRFSLYSLLVMPILLAGIVFIYQQKIVVFGGKIVQITGNADTVYNYTYTGSGDVMHYGSFMTDKHGIGEISVPDYIDDSHISFSSSGEDFFMPLDPSQP